MRLTRESQVGSLPDRKVYRVAAAALGCLAGTCVYFAATSAHPPHTDFDQIYLGARVFFSGGDPYSVVRHDQYPSYYPATAFLLAAPVVWLPLLWAQAAWSGFGTWAFATAMGRRGAWGLLALGSAPFLNAVLLGQWSPVLVGAAALPWLAVFSAGKPTIGSALLAAYPSRLAIGAAGAVVAISLIVRPEWPLHWLEVLREGSHLRAPITRPGGVLLLLGLLRWRTPEGRLIAALSVVPQTSMAYEVLPLFLIPQTARRMAVLVILSQLAFALAVSLPGIDPAHDLAGTLARQWPVWLVTCYLPALAFVLRNPTPSREPTGVAPGAASDAPHDGAASPGAKGWAVER